MSDQNNRPQPTAPAAAAAPGRRPLIIAGTAAIAVVAAALYYLLFMRGHVSTDDAYVDGNLVRLTPQVAGTVVAISTDETQFVSRGAVLVELDSRDTQVPNLDFLRDLFGR